MACALEGAPAMFAVCCSGCRSVRGFLDQVFGGPRRDWFGGG